MRMLTATQWCLVDTCLVLTLAGWLAPGTVETLGGLTVDNPGDWLLAGHNYCCKNSVLHNHMITETLLVHEYYPKYFKTTKN